MTEASWNNDANTPAIDWSVSAALENVERGGQDIAEVTSFEDAVRAWQSLEPERKALAVITIEQPIQLDGVSTSQFSGDTIAALVEHLPVGNSDA